MRLYEDDQRRAMYLDGTVPDDRLKDALEDFRPLPEIDTNANEEDPRAMIRDIVHDELK